MLMNVAACGMVMRELRAVWLMRYLRRLFPGVLVLIAFLLHATGTLELPLLQRLENHAYDLRIRWTAPGGIDPRVVIVDIDEASLRAEGHWPWDRAKLTRLMTNLFDEYRVAVVGFDMVFAERDENAALDELHKLLNKRGDTTAHALLAMLRPQLDRDRSFGADLKGRAVLLGYYFINDPEMAHRRGRLPPPAFAAGSYPADMTRAVTAHGYVANLPGLQRPAAGAGFFDNPRVDDDGVFRRVPLLQHHDGALYEALSLAVVRTYLKQPLMPVLAPDPYPSYPAMEALQVGAIRIPVDAEAAALVPFRGTQGSFRYISASDVVRKRVADPSILKGAIVLVGSTAPGLLDLRATPVQNVYPGVEIHANLVSAMLDQRIPHRPAYTRAAELVLLALLGLGLVLVLPTLGALATSLVSLVALSAVVIGNIYLWHAQQLAFPVASGVLLVLGLFVVNMAHGFFVEGRTKRQLGRLFGQYVPPELVEEMSKDPRRYALTSEKRAMTVLFSDLRDFTKMSEGLDPRALSDLMHAFLTPMTRVIHEHRGTIDKYMGDAIMAFWGAPVADPDHAARAVTAALAMQTALARLRVEFRKRNWPAIEMGIGLSTGPMNVGNMGSEFRMAYTVLGDSANLGARLESQTKNYGVAIIVSEATQHAAPGFVYRELDRVLVKGKQHPVAIFEPLVRKAEMDDALRTELALNAAALARYRAQDWDGAEKLFLELAQHGTRPVLCQTFLWRIGYLRELPPDADWNGVFVSRRREG